MNESKLASLLAITLTPPAVTRRYNREGDLLVTCGKVRSGRPLSRFLRNLETAG